MLFLSAWNELRKRCQEFIYEFWKSRYSENVKLLNADKVQGQGEMKNEKKTNTFNTLPIAVVQYSFLGI